MGDGQGKNPNKNDFGTYAKRRRRVVSLRDTERRRQVSPLRFHSYSHWNVLTFPSDISSQSPILIETLGSVIGTPLVKR